MAAKKIFISHSSKDAEIVNAFVNMILCNGLGMNKQNDIFCTSADGTGIKSGEDFKKRIKSELENATAIIQILSPEYKTSEVCLNEMGAAWVLNSKVIPITIPPIGYDIGFIHANTQQIRINIKNDLLSFFDDHKGDLFSAQISIPNYIEQVEKFIKEVDIIINVKSNTDCFFYKDHIKLVGTLRSAISSGPPWGEEDINKVSFHKYHYIFLDKPISVLSTSYPGLLDNDFDVNAFNQTKFQVFGSNEKTSNINFESYENKKVEMVGTFMGSHTGWHHTQVLFRCVYIHLK